MAASEAVRRIAVEAVILNVQYVENGLRTLLPHQNSTGQSVGVADAILLRYLGARTSQSF